MDELIQKRDNLLQKRDSLLSQKKSKKYGNRISKVTTVTRTLDSYERSKDLISKYSRLPELDMNTRLEYLHMNCPWMHVIQTEKTFLENGFMSFTTKVNFNQCGEFTFKLVIRTTEQSVQSLSIFPSSEKLSIEESNQIIELISKSETQKDISLFVYGINTILRMRHKRKKAWMSVLEDLEMDDIDQINGLPLANRIKDVDQLSMVLFNHSPTFIEITKNLKTLRIDWIIKMDGTYPRHCVSDFFASISKNSDSKDISELLKSLLKIDDVKIAILQLIKLL